LVARAADVDVRAAGVAFFSGRSGAPKCIPHHPLRHYKTRLPRFMAEAERDRP